MVVVEGSALSVDRVLAELQTAGWTIERSWRPARSTNERTVLFGEVAHQADAEAVLLAAVDGFGVVVASRGERTLIDRLIDDLRRLGPVDHRTREPKPEEIGPADARAMLGLLAEGHSLGEAASIMGLSRRTADRRLSAARRALGVERTTEAIAKAKRLGWLNRPISD